jgi:hypothetical protein
MENIWTRGEKMANEWRKLHSVEFHNLYFLSNIEMIKSRRVNWLGHLTYWREERSSYKSFVGKPKVNKPLLDRDRRIILRCICRKLIGRV